jgi:hypothetical protein
MKFKFHYLILMALTVFVASCKKDTYSPPQSALKGRLVYNGEPINVQYNMVPIELYQSGFGLKGAIVGQVAQDGSFSFLLFDGDYKLIIPGTQGPFRWNQTTGSRDTLAVKVSGNQTLDIPVTPYYVVNNAQYTVTGRDVKATFGVTKVITDANAKDIESVALFVNKTQFVSSNDNIKSASIAGSAIVNPASITVTAAAVPAITPAQNYVFVRVGIKIAGIEDWIFSPLQKISI